MKIFLILMLVLIFNLKSTLLMAEEESQNSSQNIESTPVIPAAEGESELTLDNDSKATAKSSAKETVQDSQIAICKGNSDPGDCKKTKKSTQKARVKTKPETNTSAKLVPLKQKIPSKKTEATE